MAAETERAVVAAGWLEICAGAAMSAATYDSVAALTCQLAEARETIRQLREQLHPPVLLPVLLKLTRKQEVMVRVIYGRSPNVVSRSNVYDETYTVNCDHGEKVVDVMMCNIRRKLRPFNVEILTRRGVGYFMPPASAAILRGMMGQAA